MCIILNCQAQWRDVRSTEVKRKSSPGEIATAGKVGIDSYRECLAYRIFGIAVSTPVHPAHETVSESWRNRLRFNTE